MLPPVRANVKRGGEGELELTKMGSDTGDLNGDGKLNSRDVIALMKLVLAQMS